MKKIAVLCFTILFFLRGPLFAQEQFPFLAEVKVEDVNIRAGANINFESIGKLDKDEKVVVVDKQYNWYKIELPKHIVCYISSDYVKKGSDPGEITANKVNLRAKPGTNFSILGQLNKGDTIKIIDSVDGWFKIEAPKNCFGWVNDKFLGFYSGVVEVKEAEILEEPLELTEVRKEDTALVKQQKEEYAFKAQGIIKPIVCIFDCKATHKLIDADNKIICLLKGDKSELNQFINFKVQIFGNILDNSSGPHPIIEPKKLEVIP